MRATGYTFARVQATVALPFYFAPVVTGSLTQNVYSVSIAAQIPITSFTRGLAPYTVVSTTPAAANFGLVLGNQYDIQWPAANATGFIRPPCSGEPAASLAAVQANWGSSTSGYWGANASSTIYQEVLDNTQVAQISIGENIFSILTPGDKKTQATALDTRVQEDGDYTTTTSLSSYLNNTAHNGRRLIALPVVDPMSTTNTTVLGWAAFFLLSNGNANSNYYASGTGNDPFCAVYAGSYLQGSVNPSTGTGAFRVGPVQ